MLTQPEQHKPLQFRIISIIDPKSGRPSVKDIQLAVCEAYSVTLKDMLSARRTESVITPRHVAMYLSKELTTLSLPTIGRATGGRDHTVVLYAHNKIAEQIKTDVDLAAKVAMIRGQFE